MKRSVAILTLITALAAATPSSAQLLPHPAGCPARLFCGCGAALHRFGHHVRSLWLAANWLRFPRTSPAPGMAAARRGHVMILEAPGSRPGLWLVYDANSGHHATQLHERSLAGYAIVDPSGGGHFSAAPPRVDELSIFANPFQIGGQALFAPARHRGRHHVRRAG